MTLPLMIAVQEISARLGRVTGRGLAALLRDHAPRPILLFIVGLLVLANVINVGADIGAMGEAMRLLVGGPAGLYAFPIALFCACCEIWLSYKRYVVLLKWLTLSLFAYIALLLVVRVSWFEALKGAFIPRIELTRDAAAVLVGVLGTTISPYLFFWQAAEESEDEQTEPDPRPLLQHPADAPAQFQRIRIDTLAGMAFSNVVALSIIIGTASTLHIHGITDIESAEQAASALDPIAGRFSSIIFAAGIFGTGLLAVPTLAGSVAYAVGETMGWRVGLSRRAVEAKAFYAVLAGATLIGAGIIFSPVGTIEALFWSAVLNGMAAGPMIIAMVMLGSRATVMGSLTLPVILRLLGWLTAVVMIGATAAMLVL